MSHVVALHGFAGTGHTWDALPGVIAPDLIGHGTNADVRPITFDNAVARVLQEAPDAFTLIGYSLGGRVALRLALQAPERVRRLILVSATAGIEDDEERAERLRADQKLAASIYHLTPDQFAERWGRQPIFDGDPEEARARQREDVMRTKPASLSAVLNGIGAGASEPVWDRLGELTMPAAVLAGERDAKYVAIGERLVAALPDAEPLIVVPGAGHGIPREAPGAIAALL